MKIYKIFERKEQSGEVTGYNPSTTPFISHRDRKIEKSVDYCNKFIYKIHERKEQCCDVTTPP